VGKIDDVMNAVPARRVNGAVGAAVIDNEPFDLTKTWNRTRQGSKRFRQGPFFVEARNLDDELHQRSSNQPLVIARFETVGRSD
jgi:hypothetical protein